MAAHQEKDYWSSEQYQAAASFVPQLTNTVVRYLDPKPHDEILDIGCGDGVLTVAIARSCKSIVGYDSSASMISTAQQLATKYPVHNATFEVVDCSRLAAHPYFQRGAYDKVFSNAALHWIFRDPATRNDVFRDAYAALRPGGTFVFECGGAGNVAEVVTALVGALRHVADMDVLKAREMIPWYFASEAWATQKLNEAGFTVDKIELEYRPTTLNEGQGVEGWVRLFAASILDFIEESKRDAVVKHAVENLEWATKREDGTEVIGYVRLRAIAQKPEA